MYDAAYYAAMGIDDPASFANSASPYMDSGFGAEMEGMFGGGGAPDSASGYMDAAGAMGGMAGLPPLKLLELKTNRTGGVKSRSPFAIPGNYQMPPDRDLSQKPDDPNMMGLRGRHGGVMRPSVDPAGLAQKPGPVVKSNYSNLNGLRNRAYGVSYA